MNNDELEETNRIMERLVNAPPKPHKDGVKDSLTESDKGDDCRPVIKPSGSD
jgi:hypothetical protein